MYVRFTGVSPKTVWFSAGSTKTTEPATKTGGLNVTFVVSVPLTCPRLSVAVNEIVQTPTGQPRAALVVLSSYWSGAERLMLSTVAFPAVTVRGVVSVTFTLILTLP